jgi:hypothetical protein
MNKSNFESIVRFFFHLFDVIDPTNTCNRILIIVYQTASVHPAAASLVLLEGTDVSDDLHEEIIECRTGKGEEGWHQRDSKAPRIDVLPIAH